MELKINVPGVSEAQAAQIYELSLQYFSAGEIAQIVLLQPDLVDKVIKRIDAVIMRQHTKNPGKRFGDPAQWQKNVDQLRLIRGQSWRLFRSAEENNKVKLLDQLRRINRDIAELEGLLAPIKVDAQTTLNVAEESRKALKEIFGGNKK